MTENRNFEGGILLVDKPEGITSQTAVNAVRKAFMTRQAGHTGTLDPMATGLLCVLVGRAVKASEYAVFHDKRYEAVLRLGFTTDTQDITGTVLTRSSLIPSEADVISACRRFTGEIMQVPPMYSALKVGGQKLCDLARSGKTVEREARPVTIFSIGCQKLNETDYSLSVHCSSGTYIRTLCEDIGNFLGCGGVMAALRRTSVGSFNVSDAITVDELRNIAGQTPDYSSGQIPLKAADSVPESRLIPLEKIFEIYPSVNLCGFHEKLIRSGCAVLTSKLGLSSASTNPGLSSASAGDRYRICSSSGSFFALGEIVPSSDGPALKSIKLFNL